MAGHGGTREGSIKGGKTSSRKGIPQKRSEEASNKMAERKFDPLIDLMDTAEGKNTNFVHPYAARLTDALIDIREDIKLLVDQADSKDVKKLLGKLSRLEEKSTQELSKNYVPPEIRHRTLMELMRYRYPRLKDMEISGGLDVNIPQLELLLGKK